VIIVLPTSQYTEDVVVVVKVLDVVDTVTKVSVEIGMQLIVVIQIVEVWASVTDTVLVVEAVIVVVSMTFIIVQLDVPNTTHQTPHV